jgi:hypothetical protein
VSAVVDAAGANASAGELRRGWPVVAACFAMAEFEGKITSSFQ